jgi:large conductance mechanosensitive channel
MVGSGSEQDAELIRAVVEDCRAAREELVMLKGFKQFLLRGNVVDLAVAVVIGTAFGVVVTALVKDLLTPLIAAIGGQPDFSAWQFTVNGSRFLIGDFINAVIAFVMVAAAIYFFVVAPMNALEARRRSEPTTKKCPECLSEVPLEARRCAFCAQSFAEAAAPKRFAG